ncbi:RNA degradosome polyphosphate kinase [Spirochaetia bacterium]|nr:RNA degradosome polyphosphate kinase [Spirochaetia bacterium]
MGNYLNRDLSWVDFNARVLEEGLCPDLPPLERFRFLSIVSSNFDEFFMVRVAAMKRAFHAAISSGAPQAKPDPSGLSPAEQLKQVSEKVRSIMSRQYKCLETEVFPALAAGGLCLIRSNAYTPAQKDYLEMFFMEDVYPILTPLRIEDEGPLPSIDSFSLNCAFFLLPEAIEDAEAAAHIAMVQLPPVLNRIILLPDEGDGVTRWALLDDLVLTWGERLFPGLRVRETMIFKVNRDADFSVDEKRDEDFIEAMEEVLVDRERSMAVRMVYSAGSERLRDELASRLYLEAQDLYEISGPLNLGGLLDLVNLKGKEKLRDKPWNIFPCSAFHEDEPIWDRISASDVMIHLPYESFDPVVRFFQDAAVDPNVISIKTALYRTSGNSSIIRALEQASLNGKHVTAVVELKARFDEERNISWANRLEKAGVIVVYGLSRLKVHAKITLVIRRENDRIKRYVHLSTGNYNDRTAKLYEDISLFTAREEIAYDAGLLFNMITGYSMIQPMRRLVIAPTALKRRLLELIDREIKRSGSGNPGRIMAKLNALADTDIIAALYRASQAGVRIALSIRGICTLIPGVAGLSENIRVTGIIDHYLEHSRIIYFANGGAEEIYLSSADWMPRNLERRIELMFPVQEESLRLELREILESYFRDNCQARLLDSSGNWKRLHPQNGEESFRVQARLLARAARSSAGGRTVKQEFVVRRKTIN